MANYTNYSKEYKAQQERMKNLSTEERRRIASKGGQATKLNYNRKKTLKDLLVEAMEMKNDKTGNENAIDVVLAQIAKAQAGDTKAAEFVRDTMGQRPAENVSMQVELPEFVDDLKE